MREKIAPLTGQLNTLLEQAEVDLKGAAEAKQPEQRDLQAFLLQSCDEALEKARSALDKASSAAEAIEQSRRDLPELRTELKAMVSKSARFRSQRLENDRYRNQAATGSGNMDQVIHEMSERIRALEDELTKNKLGSTLIDHMMLLVMR
jgi:chromosome segregation ATPase